MQTNYDDRPPDLIYKEKSNNKNNIWVITVFNRTQCLQTDGQTDRENETVLEHHQVKPCPLMIWTEDQVLQNHSFSTFREGNPSYSIIHVDLILIKAVLQRYELFTQF